MQQSGQEAVKILQEELLHQKACIPAKIPLQLVFKQILWLTRRAAAAAFGQGQLHQRLADAGSRDRLDTVAARGAPGPCCRCVSAAAVLGLGGLAACTKSSIL